MTSPPPEQPFERALALARGGRTLERRRDLSGALELYGDAERLLEGAAASPLLANVLRWKGTVLRDQGDLDGAEEYYRRSLEAAEECGSLEARAAAENCRAAMAQRRGDAERAIQLYGSATALATEAGEIHLVGLIEMNLGVLSNIRGDLTGAQSHYRTALRAFQDVGDDRSASWVLNNLGLLLNDRALPAVAEKVLLRGLDIARSRGDRHMQGILLTSYAESLIARALWDDAAATLEEAFQIVCEGDEPGRAGEVLKFLGVLERERGRLHEAEEHFREALSVATSVHDRLLTAEIMRERGKLHLRRGHRDAAVRDWSEARKAFERAGAVRDADETCRLIEETEGCAPDRLPEMMSDGRNKKTAR